MSSVYRTLAARLRRYRNAKGEFDWDFFIAQCEAMDEYADEVTNALAEDDLGLLYDGNRTVPIFPEKLAALKH